MIYAGSIDREKRAKLKQFDLIPQIRYIDLNLSLCPRPKNQKIRTTNEFDTSTRRLAQNAEMRSSELSDASGTRRWQSLRPLDRFRGRREWDTQAAFQENGLEDVVNIFVHDRAAPITLDVG